MEDKLKKISFKLINITTEQFAIIEEDLSEENEVKINVALRFGANEEQKLIVVYTTFTFLSLQKPFIVIEAGCHFEIHDDAWEQMYDPQSKALKVSRGLLSHLAMLTVGTTRGILYAKTEGTRFNKYIVPTINVLDLIKEDTVFKFRPTEITDPAS